MEITYLQGHFPVPEKKWPRDVPIVPSTCDQGINKTVNNLNIYKFQFQLTLIYQDLFHRLKKNLLNLHLRINFISNMEIKYL